MAVIEFKNEDQEWTKSEIERFAYLHFKRGLDFNNIKVHFELTRNHYETLIDYINENSKYKPWVKKEGKSEKQM